MACRACRLLNGGRLVFSAKYQSAVSVFTCTWLAYLGLFSWLSWSEGIWSPSIDLVGLAVLNRPHLVGDLEPELLDDLVRVALRLRRGVPHVEVGVADQHGLGVRVVRLPHVRPGARRHVVAGQLQRRVTRHRERERQRELVHQLGVGRGQVERQGVGRVVGDHALGQVAALGAALVRADQARVERGRPGHGELPLERPDEVAGLERLAVGELDPLADMEQVGLAAVGRRGDGGGEVGHDLRTRHAAHLGEPDQAVVGVDEQLPLLQRVVLRRVGDAEGGVGQDREGAALVPGRGRRRARAGAGRRAGAAPGQDQGQRAQGGGARGQSGAMAESGPAPGSRLETGGTGGGQFHVGLLAVGSHRPLGQTISPTSQRCNALTSSAGSPGTGGELDQTGHPTAAIPGDPAGLYRQGATHAARSRTERRRRRP